MLAAPSLLLLELGVSYALVPWACERSPAALHVLLGSTLAMALILTALSWRDGAAQRASHQRFLRLVGVAVGALASLVVVAQWLTALVIDPCLSSL